MSFNTSTRKEDVSLKLRAVNLHKARDETKQLEEESRKMEERLQELKIAMTREKEERERAQSGFWAKGKQGLLTGYAQEVLAKPKVKGQKPKKVKVLKDEPIVPPVRAKVPGTLRFIAERGMNGKENKIRGPKCGQCEQKAAQVSCLECGEEYCASCFAAFHLRGNLKKHRSIPIGTKVSRTPRGNITPRKSPMDSPSMQHSNDSRGLSQQKPAEHFTQNGSKKSLFDGDYNEAESAATFQQALREWRADDGPTNQPPPVSPVRSPVVSMEHGTSTDSELQPKMPDIKFHSSLSYAEKLMLKRHRRTELQPLPGDLTSRSVTDRESSRSREYDQLLSSRSEPYGSDSPEETLVQVLSEPAEELDDGIHWQDMHRAMNTDDTMRCDSRSESRLSIIELDDDQPDKSRRRSKRVAETSSYHVSEAGNEEDMEILTARMQSARKRQSARKSSSRRKREKTDSSLPTSATQRDSNSRQTSAARAQKEAKPAETKIQLDSVVNDEKSRQSPAPRSAMRPRSSRQKSARAGQSRPQSRAMSRAETRLALFGEGTLTKTPSEALKEVSRMTPRHHDPAPYMPTMGEFFTSGSELTGGDVDSQVPTTANKSKGIPGASGIPKWKVSYNLYNIGPRSWKPEKSLQDQVGEDEAAQTIDEISDKLQTFLAPDDEDQLLGIEPYSPGDATPLKDSNVINRHSSVGRQESRADNNDQSEVSSARKLVTPNGIQSRSRADEYETSDRLEQLSRTGTRSRSRASKHEVANRSAALTPSGIGRERTNYSSDGDKDATAETPRPESRAIVIDGDDLTSYDFEDNSVERNAEDEEALYQLEWELASQDGRITEDGKLSRLSLVITPVEEEVELMQETYDASLDMPQQNPGYMSPGASLDMRMNNLMEDFEEMEQKVNDEEDVKALA